MPIRGVNRPHTSVHVTLKREDGSEVTGTFVWVRRRYSDIGLIAAEQSRRTGGQPIVDKEMGVIITALSELTVVTLEWPDWWKEEMDDIGLLIQLWNRYTDWRDSFRRRTKPDAPEDPSASGEAGDASEGADPASRGESPAGLPAEMVVPQISRAGNRS